MKNTPLISVIVPVYKVEKYLAECLDSICCQTYKNLEIICVNDGSPDNCAEILQNYAARDPRITVITQQNQGLSASRNNALLKAAGEYVTFVDSDDAIAPEMIEELYRLAQTEQADVVIGNLVRTDEKGREQNTLSFWRHLDKNGKIHEADTDIPQTFRLADISDCIYATPCFAWGKLYRRSFLQDHNISFINGLIYEDIVYFTDIIIANPLMSFVNKPFYKYRIQENSICRTKSAKQLDILRVLDIVRRKIRENKLEHLLGSNLYYLTNYNLTWGYFVIPDDCKKQYVKEVKKHLTRKDYNRFLAFVENVKVIDFGLFRIKLSKKKK